MNRRSRAPACRCRPGRVRSLAWLAPLLLAAGACTEIENVMARIPLFAYMRDTPALEPYEAPRPAPPGAVPFASPAVELLPELPATEAALREFGDVTPNPLPATAEVLALGQEVYLRHCWVCHGPAGRGDAPVVGPGLIPFVPDLTAPLTRDRTDGYLYGIIRVGRGLMPDYGSRVNHTERWAIVHYLRQLQAAGNGAPAPGPRVDPDAPAEEGS